MIGTFLLSLPFAKAGPGSATLLEAFFTAVSAVCVTGHTVVDTKEYWTPFGHAVILVLIQVGGLGIMVFASLIGLALARRLSLRSRMTAASEAKSVGVGDVKVLLVGIVKISATIEGAVAVILTLRWWLGYGYDLPQALWLGVFHAVSSFNNAGFALFSGNLTSFASDPIICLPIAAAIILGGLGFPVLMQLRRELGVTLHWSMNTKLVLWATSILLVLGTVFIAVIEWENPRTLGDLDAGARILAAFFQSVQTRTAGFNSVDIGALDPATLFGMDIFMFIGGGPASTAGGIKVTTFAVLFFIMYTELRGEGAVNIFGKRLSRAVHRQAITVVLLAVAVVVGSTVLLMLITDFELDVILFEVISAFSTVGLSAGITADLPVAGQLILIALMFIGRLGPVTLASAIALRERRILYEYPQERPGIG